MTLKELKREALLRYESYCRYGHEDKYDAAMDAAREMVEMVGLMSFGRCASFYQQYEDELDACNRNVGLILDSVNQNSGISAQFNRMVNDSLYVLLEDYLLNNYRISVYVVDVYENEVEVVGCEDE